jgi:hypothetical protein
MSDTPRTDAYIGEGQEDCMTEGEIAMCDFARQLERELDDYRANAKYRCSQLQDQRDRLAEALNQAAEIAVHEPDRLYDFFMGFDSPVREVLAAVKGAQDD